MYAKKATPNSDSFLPKGPKPIFVRSDDIRNSTTRFVSGEEIFIALTKVVTKDNVCGIQQIRSLWRIYLSSQEERIRLISDGLELRGASTPVYDLNPFTQLRDDNLTRVCVKDVPLSVDDDLIRLELQAMKHEVRGPVHRQKLRVNGQLTSCKRPTNFVS